MIILLYYNIVVFLNIHKRQFFYFFLSVFIIYNWADHDVTHDIIRQLHASIGFSVAGPNDLTIHYIHRSSNNLS